MTAFEGNDNGNGERIRPLEEIVAEADDIYVTIRRRLDAIMRDVPPLLRRVDSSGEFVAVSMRFADSEEDITEDRQLYLEARNRARVDSNQAVAEHCERQLDGLEDMYTRLTTIWDETLQRAASLNVLSPAESIKIAREIKSLVDGIQHTLRDYMDFLRSEALSHRTFQISQRDRKYLLNVFIALENRGRAGLGLAERARLGAPAGSPANVEADRLVEEFLGEATGFFQTLDEMRSEAERLFMLPPRSNT